MFGSILTGLLLAIATALATSILTYHFTNKAKKAEAMMKFREEKYTKLLVLLEGFVGNTASAETKRAFFKEQHESWLYCSDEATRAINHMIDLVANNKGMIRVKGEDPVGAIVLAMRKDLLGKTKLSTSDFRYIDVIEENKGRHGRHN